MSMALYRCVLYGAAGRIVGVKLLACRNETGAARQARGLFAERPRARTAALWRGRKLVAIVVAPPRLTSIGSAAGTPSRCRFAVLDGSRHRRLSAARPCR
jgi:hypothetical protein